MKLQCIIEKAQIISCTQANFVYVGTTVITCMVPLMQAWCFAENDGPFSLRFLNRIPIYPWHCKQSVNNSTLEVLLWSAFWDVIWETLHFKHLLLILCTSHSFAVHESMLCDHLRLLITWSLAVFLSAPERFLLYPFLPLNMTWNNSEKSLWPRGVPLAAATSMWQAAGPCWGWQLISWLLWAGRSSGGRGGVGRKEQGRVPRENCLVWQLE